MKQVLGKKKHKLCEEIGSKSYHTCYTTREHHIFQCWIDTYNAEYIHTIKRLILNYKIDNGVYIVVNEMSKV